MIVIKRLLVNTSYLPFLVSVWFSDIKREGGLIAQVHT